MISLFFLFLATHSAQRYIELHEFERAIPLIKDKQVLGALYLRTCEYEKALSLVKDSFQLGYIYEHLDKPDSAILFYKNSRSDLKSHSLYRIGQCFVIMKKYSEAVNYLNQLLTGYPDFIYATSAAHNLADSYAALENYDMALSVIEKYYSPPLSLYYSARIKERAKKSAYSEWLKLATNYPDSRYAKYCLDELPSDSARLKGRINYFAGNYEDAIFYLGDIKGEEKLIALSLYSLKKYERAEMVAREIGLWKLAGDCQRRLGTLELALSYYQKSTDPESIFWVAYILNQLGRKEEAIQKYKEVPLESENAEVANLRIITLSLELNKINDGLDGCKDISAPTSYYWYNQLYKMKGNEDSAKMYFNKLVKEYPFSYYCWLINERNIYAFRGRISSILLECNPEEWLNKTNNNYYSLNAEERNTFNRGSLLLKLGIQKEGVDELRSIKEKHPLFMWKLAKLFYSYGISDVAVAYAKQIEPSSGPIPRKIAEILYPICFLPTIDALPEGKKIDEFLLLALMREESVFNPFAVSYANAMGLTQVIPPTAKKIAKELGVHQYNIFNPTTAVRFGAHYLNKTLNLFNNKIEFALAAYNGGPTNVRNWINTMDTSNIDRWVEQIPYDQTRRYVKRVIGNYFAYELIYGE